MLQIQNQECFFQRKECTRLSETRPYFVKKRDFDCEFATFFFNRSLKIVDSPTNPMEDCSIVCTPYTHKRTWKLRN